MTIQGTIVNGAVILDQPALVPDGTRVEITLEEPAVKQGEGKRTLAALLKYAGCMPDLPADFAAQHDHYSHGTPKK
jgi:hypothetical protein